MAAEISLKRIRAYPRLEGEITPLGDKSISHRAVILNSLTEGEATISNFSPGNDCAATITCLKALGVKIKRLDSDKFPTQLVKGVGKTGLAEAENILDARNSATTMRLLAGLLAAQPFLSIITGDASLRTRPMGRLIEPLRLMGAEIWGRGGDSFAPLVIRGKKLHGISYSLPIPSAQLKSAVLLAALFAKGSTTVEEPLPSRDHTERLLKQMGAEVNTVGNQIVLNPLTTPLSPLSLHIPGDISSAAYWLVAGAIHPNAKIKIRDCGINPTRTGIIDALLAMGARIKIENQRSQGNEPIADIYVESSELKGIEVSSDMIPRLIDEIPVLAVAGCVAKGNTVIRNASELRVKESDRITTTVEELSRLGAKIEELADGISIQGGKTLQGAVVNSHYDHRLAMSLAIAGMVAQGETVIRHAEIAKISYPTFWQDLEKLASY